MQNESKILCFQRNIVTVYKLRSHTQAATHTHTQIHIFLNSVSSKNSLRKYSNNKRHSQKRK